MIQELEQFHWFPVCVQEIVDHHYTHRDHNKPHHYQNAAGEKKRGLL
jgi:hypothetical protein